MNQVSSRAMEPAGEQGWGCVCGDIELAVGTSAFDSVGTPHAAANQGNIDLNIERSDKCERELDVEAPVNLVLCEHLCEAAAKTQRRQ